MAEPCLDDPRALIAVSAASNRSKADQDPSTWLPPYAGYRLTIDPAEQTALAQRLAACPDQPITVTLTRSTRDWPVTAGRAAHAPAKPSYTAKTTS